MRITQTLLGVVALLVLPMSLAYGYEEKLQFQFPVNAKSQSVIGMQFITNLDGSLGVKGNISYYTQSCSRYNCGPKTYYNFIGTWDTLGNLTSKTAGSLPPQRVLATNGTAKVYAQTTSPTGPSTAGLDTRGYGYVDVPASHFTWCTPKNQIGVIPDQVTTIPVCVKSNGDFALNISAETANAFSTTGYYNSTGGTATVGSTTCTNPVASGTQCTVNVQYDPTTICTTSPYGYAYTTVTLDLATDAGNLPGWQERFTITGVPSCPE